MEGYKKFYISEEKAKEILREGLEGELVSIGLLGENRFPSILADTLEEFHFDIDAVMAMDSHFLSDLFFKYTTWEQTKQITLRKIKERDDYIENDGSGEKIPFFNLDMKKVLDKSLTIVES